MVIIPLMTLISIEFHQNLFKKYYVCFESRLLFRNSIFIQDISYYINFHILLS